MARPTVPGRSVAFAQTAAINRTSSALPPFGESANVNCRDVIANQIFHRMWKNLFAVAGTRERLPAGVIDKRGLRPPLARPRRAGATFPPPAGGDPPLEAGTSVRLAKADTLKSNGGFHIPLEKWEYLP